MAKTFKVGDKVRILDVSNILYGSRYWNDGHITEVAEVDDLGLPRLKRSSADAHGLQINSGELNAIELVDGVPTKKQRIKALETEVEALKVEVAELKKARSKKLSDVTVNVDIAKIADELATKILQKTPKPPNQRRKAVIERAKAFVADVEEKALSGTKKHNGNYTFNLLTTKPEYHVDKEKRVVTVLAKGIVGGRLFEKAIAKCAPGAVFNVHIGKAIALAKAYGLEIPQEVTNAPQPTEYAVGQSVIRKFTHDSGVPACFFDTVQIVDNHRDNTVDEFESIVDDSEAVYE